MSRGPRTSAPAARAPALAPRAWLRARAFPAAVALAVLLAWIACGDAPFGPVVADVIHRATPVLLIALGQALVIASGGVDLSVGAVMAVASSLVAKLFATTGLSAPVAIALALLAGLTLGAWNGLLVARLRVPPIVATLVLLTAGRGVAQLISGGGILTFQRPELVEAASARLLGVPLTAVLVAALFTVAGAFARGTTFGFHLEAVGSNERAARLSGLAVDRVLLAAYATCGLLAALAGVVVCADVGAADASHVGLYSELDAILAAVIGGNALTGGRLSLTGALLGALANQALTTALLLAGLGTAPTLCIKAAVVLVAVALQRPGARGAEVRA